MWARNLLFAAVCLSCGLVLASMLSRPVPRSGRDAPRAAYPVFAEVVAQIDADFRRQWRALGIESAAPAPDLMIGRRLSLALEGTIPSLEEIRQLEARRPGNQIEWWLDRILADPRCADYLAERLARPLVGLEDGPFLVYRRHRFVSWLADEIHRNRPYDEIVRRVISDTGLWTDHPATNFITAAITADDNLPNEDKLATRISRTLLGLRLDCARCHDHPFNPRWEQRHFQSLAAFFGPAELTISGIRDTGEAYRAADGNTGREVIVAPAVPFSEELLPEHGTGRRRLAVWITHRENKAFARATVNRVWALMFGRPLVEPVDDLPIDGPQPPALVVLADDFADHGYDLKRLIRLIAATEVFQTDSRAPAVQPQHPANWAAFPLTRLRPEQVAGSLLQSASLTTIDRQSHILVRVARTLREREFVERFGDAGERELDERGGTIPQRLLLMNGELVQDKIKDDLMANAATRIAVLAPDDPTAVDTAYLAVLTRRPTPEEAAHFTERLAGTKGGQRKSRLADLYWALINSTEFSWNH